MLLFFSTFHITVSYHACRNMADLRGDGDGQSGGDTVDALKLFSKR